jgi:hypothetical protein
MLGFFLVTANDNSSCQRTNRPTWCWRKVDLWSSCWTQLDHTEDWSLIWLVGYWHQVLLQCSDLFIQDDKIIVKSHKNRLRDRLTLFQDFYHVDTIMPSGKTSQSQGNAVACSAKSCRITVQVQKIWWTLSVSLLIVFQIHVVGPLSNTRWKFSYHWIGFPCMGYGMPKFLNDELTLWDDLK